jgi:hypothetical protein
MWFFVSENLKPGFSVNSRLFECIYIRKTHYPEITPPRSLLWRQETAHDSPIFDWRGLMRFFATPFSNEKTRSLP